MKKTTLILFILLSIFNNHLKAGDNNFESQDIIAARWANGEYTSFPDNGYGMFSQAGKKTVKFNKDKNGRVTSVEIGFNKHEIWTNSNSTWVDGYSKNNYYCLYFTNESITSYVIEDGKAKSINGFYGAKLGSKKKAIAEINEYLEYSKIKVENDKKSIADEKATHKAKHSIQGREIKELKIEIIADNQQLDCGSVFEVGFIATTTEGNVIKSKNLGGEAYDNDFYISVEGASKEKVKRENDYFYSYTAKPYCEAYKEKELIIKVSSSDINKKSEIKKFTVNCVPDPAIIQAKKESEKREKEYAEYLKKEEARKKEEAKNPQVKVEKTEAPISKTYAGIDLTSYSDYTKSDRLRLRNAIQNSNGDLIIFGNASWTTDYPGKMSIYSGFENGMNNLKGKNKFYGKNLTFNDMSLVDDNSYLIASTGSLNYVKSSDDANLEKLNELSYAGKEGTEDYRDFCAVVNMGNGYCVALSSNSSKVKYNHVVYRKSLYLHIWNYKTNAHTEFKLSSKEVNTLPKILKTKDNQIVILYNEFQDIKFNDDLYNVAFDKSTSIIQKIDPIKSASNNSLVSIWKSSAIDNIEITDAVEDISGNIVFAFKSSYKYLEKYELRNLYCSVGIGRLNSKGENLQTDSYEKMSLSYFSGDKYELYKGNDLYMSAWGKPQLIQAVKDNGYLLVHHLAYNVGRPVKTEEYKFLDQPVVIYHEGDNLIHQSMDIIYTDHKGPKYSSDAGISQKFTVKDIQYHVKSGSYIITESENQINSSGPGEHNAIDEVTMWLTNIRIFDGFVRVDTEENSSSSTTANNNYSNKNRSSSTSTATSSSNSSSSSSSSNSKTEEFIGQVYFHFDHTNKTKGERLYIHYGSNGSSKTSTGVGSDASIKCEAGKVYYSFTGEKKDMILITEIKSSDCKKKFYSKDFVK